MIQLNNKKKLIILITTIFIIATVLVIKLSFNKKNTVTSENTIPENSNSIPTARDMTREEKIKVGISPSQEAEVVNDQNGLYIYRLKK